MLAQAFISGTRKLSQEDLCEFEVSLVDKGSLRTVRNFYVERTQFGFELYFVLYTSKLMLCTSK